MGYALITFFDYWFELKKKLGKQIYVLLRNLTNFIKKKKKYLKYKISLGFNKDVYILH